VLTAQGVLTQCQVVSEDPPGSGFGAAAVTLSSRFLMRPATVDGRPVDSEVRIPITWPRQYLVAGPRRNVVRVQWITAPSLADVNARVPSRSRNVDGRAEIVCTLLTGGRTHNCYVVMQYPANAGFGIAARDLALRFRTTPGSWPNAQSRTNPSVVFIPFSFPAQSRPAEPVSAYAWREQPSPDAIAAAFPEAARAANIQGAVVILNCIVGPGGVPGDCSLGSESAANLGFGAAALTLATQYRMALWTADGRPTVGSAVTLTIPFSRP
jgi:hypothetical protein